ncbi:hypothetical protein AB1484_18720 [Parafrankia sp. FMc6]|uniref:hypothetical protein n=1 Tax=Parafrankia soli TaxID=2599596 RepID=UPI0034D3D50E
MTATGAGPVREAVTRLVADLTATARLPPLLSAAADRLEATGWHEVATSWSRLTPTGFPVELTAGRHIEGLRWTAEVAAPEVPDTDRLFRAAELLDAHHQCPRRRLVDGLACAQSSAELRFGAWLGGRESPGADPGLKLYAELPAPGARPRGPRIEPGAELDVADVVLAAAGAAVPPGLAAALRGLPPGTRARMLGVEPGRARHELYLRLPDVDALDLVPFLHALGSPGALAGAAGGLPDGLRRLAGRRLGLSVAWSGGEVTSLTFFVSARSLFPAAPGALRALVPDLGRVRDDRVRRALVGLTPTTAREGSGERGEPAVCVGLVPAPGTRYGTDNYSGRQWRTDVSSESTS